MAAFWLRALSYGAAACVLFVALQVAVAAGESSRSEHNEQKIRRRRGAAAKAAKGGGSVNDKKPAEIGPYPYECMLRVDGSVEKQDPVKHACSGHLIEVVSEKRKFLMTTASCFYKPGFGVPGEEKKEEAKKEDVVKPSEGAPDAAKGKEVGGDKKGGETVAVRNGEGGGKSPEQPPKADNSPDPKANVVSDAGGDATEQQQWSRKKRSIGAFRPLRNENVDNIRRRRKRGAEPKTAEKDTKKTDTGGGWRWPFGGGKAAEPPKKEDDKDPKKHAGDAATAPTGGDKDKDKDAKTIKEAQKDGPKEPPKKGILATIGGAIAGTVSAAGKLVGLGGKDDKGPPKPKLEDYATKLNFTGIVSFICNGIEKDEERRFRFGSADSSGPPVFSIYTFKDFNPAWNYDTRDIALIPMAKGCDVAQQKAAADKKVVEVSRTPKDPIGFKHWQIPPDLYMPPIGATCLVMGWNPRQKTAAAITVTVTSPSACLRTFKGYGPLSPPMCTTAKKKEKDFPKLLPEPKGGQIIQCNPKWCNAFTSPMLVCPFPKNKTAIAVGFARFYVPDPKVEFQAHASFYYVMDFFQAVAAGIPKEEGDCVHYYHKEEDYAT